jgi:DNA-binding NarL/FixJ family response regulator
MTSIFHLEKFRFIRDTTRLLIGAQPFFRYAGETDSVDDFLKILPATSVNILLLDVESCADCPDFCSFMRADYPEVKIILHTNGLHPGQIERMIKEGVKGFVSKHASVNDLSEALYTITEGEMFICPVLRRGFLNFDAFLEDKRIKLIPVKAGFTCREEEVLQLIAKGYASKNIAVRLSIGVKTVETHRKNIMVKAGVKNTAALMIFLANQGMLHWALEPLM